MDAVHGRATGGAILHAPGQRMTGGIIAIPEVADAALEEVAAKPDLSLSTLARPG